MQFSQLQDLVNCLQDEPEYDMPSDEHDRLSVTPTNDPGPQADHQPISLSYEENVLPAASEHLNEATAVNNEEFVQHTCPDSPRADER